MLIECECVRVLRGHICPISSATCSPADFSTFCDLQLTLPEVNGSVRVAAPHKAWYKKYWSYVGLGFIISVGYSKSRCCKQPIANCVFAVFSLDDYQAMFCRAKQTLPHTHLLQCQCWPPHLLIDGTRARMSIIVINCCVQWILATGQRIWQPAQPMATPF